MKDLTLRGVRVHNLKSIDIAIPLHRLTVVTGVSGAGKRSLVFDTLYTEAQRRCLQSFSAYTRQFLERFDQPDADEIGDLPPAVAIRRSPSKTSARATVGSLTEIDASLRLLFARAGTLFCPTCKQIVRAHRPADVIEFVQALPAGARATIAFPAVPPTEADQPAWLAALLEEGYHRLQIGATVYRLGEQPIPHLASTDNAWVLLDRIEVGKTPIDRLSESIDAAFRRGQGRLGILTDTNEHRFDQRLVCPGCQRVFAALEPRLFDANDPLGACPACEGTGALGKTKEICPTCQGRRWNADALAVQLDGRTIADWHALPLDELLAIVPALKLDAVDGAVLVEQIQDRLESIASLGLGYLTLGQLATTLSDGAARRIALASALTLNLVNVLYLIDEPTVGLHPRDLDKLVTALIRLRERGNTIVVIEHHRQVLAVADHVIELGPGAGEEGGTITYQGPPTGLTADDRLEISARRRKPTGFLKLSGACTNNLRDLTVEFPLGVLCVITGVSGAGKSSLIEQTLYPALCLAKNKRADPTTAKISGAHQLTDVLLLDQTPLARSSRSNPATYLKIFDEIRALFAESIDARIRNFGPGHFSFNQPGGRCETCEGQGTLTIDMQFLADVTTTCPECHGRRYRKEILDIKVRSLSIAEVLDLTIRAAFRFRAQPAIEKKLKVLLDVGLDYLRLGQAVETLAGGECQRLKLAGQLASSRKTACLFLLIEPTVGLAGADIANLLACFDRLLSTGHSLIAIEHDLDVIAQADYVIDLGPEGGNAGGRLVAQGTPEEVAEVAGSHTGAFLKTILAV